MEHVGVGYDWDLGYRKKEELTYWKNFDVETNPKLWDSTSKEISRINNKVIQYMSLCT